MESKRINILMVEDNPGDAFLIRKNLGAITDSEYEIEQAETLEAALKILDERRFDAVLLDLNLPGTERLQVIKSVAAASTAAIIILTSIHDNALAIKAIATGIQDFLCKDQIEDDKLHSAIQFALQRQKATNKLHSLAYRDELTGIPNRNVLIDDFEKITAERSNAALLIVNIKNLKDVVMAHGLHVAESVLKSAASRLYGAFKADKTLVRLEGDNFGLLQSGFEHSGHILYTARRAKECLEGEFEALGHKIYLEVCVGIALYPEHAEDWDGLWHCAFIALEQAKCENGEGIYQIYGGEVIAA